MNYRHAFHAGNFADIWKHVILMAALEALNRKASPWAYVDTHAGAGLYALDAQEAARTGEWRDGIGRILDRRDVPDAIAHYLSAVTDAGAGRYPGSPWLAMQTSPRNTSILLTSRSGTPA